MNNRTTAIAALATAAFSSGALATVTTFDNGDEGWSIQNAVTIENSGGNPGNFLSHFQIDTFGVTVSNSRNPAFIGDYSAKGESVSVSMDIEVTRVWDQFIGDVSRELVVEFRNHDLAQGGLPYTSVWTSIGVMTTGTPWTTVGTTIDDTSSATLPAGWGGYGAEDPNTFEPILPAGVTFADVLSNVDELVFTTYVPGYFFGFTNYDFGVDNMTITPTPGAASVFALAGVAGLRRKR